MANSHELATFHKLRRKGYPVLFAMRYARTLDAFEDAQNEGRARIRFEGDSDSSLAENYDSEAYKGDRQGRAAWAKLERIEERDGWFGAIVEIRTDEESDTWQHVDSLWGLLGTPTDDGFGGPGFPLEYACDHMQSALAALAEHDASAEQLAKDVATVRELLDDVEQNGGDRARAAFERIASKVLA